VKEVDKAQVQFISMQRQGDARGNTNITIPMQLSEVFIGKLIDAGKRKGTSNA
jgi:hypothetical protein